MKILKVIFVPKEKQTPPPQDLACFFPFFKPKVMVHFKESVLVAEMFCKLFFSFLQAISIFRIYYFFWNQRTPFWACSILLPCGWREVSVHCPFYVVLLVNVHKKQCNVKRALASDAQSAKVTTWREVSNLLYVCVSVWNRGGGLLFIAGILKLVYWYVHPAI